MSAVISPAFLLACGAKVALLLLVAAGTTRALRHASAATRHAVWTVSVIGALAVPALALLLPAYRSPAAARAVGLLVRRYDAGLRPRALRQPDAPRAAAAPASLANAPVGTSVVGPGQRTPDELLSPKRSRISPWSLALLVWALGAIVALLRSAAGIVAARRLVARATPLAAPPVVIARAAALLESPDLGVPATVGVWRHAVLLPRAAKEWTPEAWRAVLLHELAHVERRDCLTALIAQIACAVHWYNPLVWYAARRMCVERERACDDRVLAAGAPPERYASLLLDAARASFAFTAPPAAALAMARPSELESRFQAILDPAIRRGALSRRARAVLAMLAAAVTVPVAALGLDAAVPQPTTRASQTTEGVRPAPGADVDVDRTRSAAQLASGAAPRTTVLARPEVDGARQTSPSPAESPTLPADISPRGDTLPPEPDQRGDSLAGPASERIPSVGPVRDAREGVPSASGPDSVAIARLLHERSTHIASGEADLVRERASWALGRVRDGRLVEPMIEALGDPDWRVRAYAAWAIAVAGDRRAVPSLLPLLTDPVWRMRAAAAAALEALGDPQATPAMVVALRDPAWQVRVAAVGYLARLGDPSARALVERMSTDRHIAVRSAADEALAGLARSSR